MKMFPNAIYEDELKNKDGIKNKGEPQKNWPQNSRKHHVKERSCSSQFSLMYP